ncbi:alpha/beta fold hydrolase [Mucilaginibacter rubeus]|uniref:alpha/beta fold hydrolase n=1 Tax=Mucilaginibacter rubeus TaxID=2027860 RepID=UPI00166748D1|nr:alpha/beta hydrolase [Mucilaginibacter rubeus]
MRSQIHHHAVRVNNAAIACQIVNPEQQYTVFFIHGNSGSADTWNLQLTEPLFKEYRIIAIDLPAHGNSSIPEDLFDFSVLGMAALLAAVVKVLIADNPFVLVGLSLGTNVVAEILPYVNISGIVLISPSIITDGNTLNKLFKPGANVSVFFTDNVEEREVENVLGQCIEDNQEEIFNKIKSDYYRVKGDFRSMLHKSVMKEFYSDEIRLITGSGLKPLVIFGASDPLCNIDYLDDDLGNICYKEIYKLSNARHFPQIDQWRTVNDLLYKYLNDACQKSIRSHSCDHGI